MKVKQAIIIRKDLGMRRGKEIAQGAHASMAWLVDLARHGVCINGLDVGDRVYLNTSAEEDLWLNREDESRKVVLQVNSEQELIDLKKAADEAGLTNNMIVDLGLTQFKGVPTRTCLAIGPARDELIDSITSHLKLY